MIKSRNGIVELIQKLNETNASEILEELIDVHDEEGKNAPIIALEEGLLDAFRIMIKPVMTKKGYKIYYDPFNNGVVCGTKALKWNTTFDTAPKTCPTRTKFYSVYSPYSYLENSNIESDIKRMLMNECHAIDYDITEGMEIGNIAVKDNVKAELYTDEDIIRYVPIPLHKIARIFLANNIPVESYSCNRHGHIKIVIEFKKLSYENKQTATMLLTLLQDDLVTSADEYFLNITMVTQKSDKVKDIEDELGFILGGFEHQALTKHTISVEEQYRRTIQFFTLLKKPIDSRLSKVELCRKANPMLTLSSDGKFFYTHPAVKEREEQYINRKGE